MKTSITLVPEYNRFYDDINIYTFCVTWIIDLHIPTLHNSLWRLAYSLNSKTFYMCIKEGWILHNILICLPAEHITGHGIIIILKKSNINHIVCLEGHLEFC